MAPVAVTIKTMNIVNIYLKNVQGDLRRIVYIVAAVISGFMVPFLLLELRVVMQHYPEKPHNENIIQLKHVKHISEYTMLSKLLKCTTF